VLQLRLSERGSNEHSAGISTQAGATGHAPSTKYGGFIQAPGDPEGRPKGSLRAPSPRDGNNASGSNGTPRISQIAVGGNRCCPIQTRYRAMTDLDGTRTKLDR
jgi:hypothetical protein